jgi:hypothetical protein
MRARAPKEKKKDNPVSAPTVMHINLYVQSTGLYPACNWQISEASFVLVVDCRLSNFSSVL